MRLFIAIQFAENILDILTEFQDIPLSTIKKWEADQSNQNYRKCPEYVSQLLEKAVLIDFATKV